MKLTQDNEDFLLEDSGILETWKRLFSHVFMALCRPFNSREVTVVRNSQQQSLEYYKYEQIGPRGMSLCTENFLRGNLIRHSLEKKPQKILSTINDFYKISGDPVYRLIAADVCRYFSRKAAAKEKIRFYLAAFRYCYLAFLGQRPSAGGNDDLRNNSFLLQELQIFNEAIAGIFRYLQKSSLLDSSAFSLRGISDNEFIFEKPQFHLSVPRNAVADFSLCSDYSVKALRLINRHSGIGIPLVARISAPELSRSLKTPPGMTIPVTLFFRVKIHSQEKFSLYPYYQDTSVNEIFQIDENCPGKGCWNLSRDFSTPLACFMNDITQRNLLAGMLNPLRYDKMSGLYMVEPYRPEKIPVVFIHGLMSSPETWGQMINSLKYDPEIRRKYQFWFFSYSTGVPVPYSASKLRHALFEAQKEFCTEPEATRNFEQMVLVGHSMGGLIARLLLLQDPYYMVKTVTGKSWEECRALLSPADLQCMQNLVVMNPLPFVRRCVFMAVPHRGSAVAQKHIAKLGIRLIRMPRPLIEVEKHCRRIWHTLMPNEKICWRKDSFITGIDNLHPQSLFVRWAADSPLKKDVIYHSIIGNRKEANRPGGSDGIVPYSSSHLDGIASECIVKSDHSVHRNPEAIRELLRLLLLHLEENTKTVSQ